MVPSSATATVTARTPVRAECSCTGTQTRTPSARSAVTGAAVVNARPARLVATFSSATTLRREDAGHRLQHHLLEVDQVQGDVGADRTGDPLQQVRDVLRVGLAQAGHHGSDVDHAQR